MTSFNAGDGAVPKMMANGPRQAAMRGDFTGSLWIIALGAVLALAGGATLPHRAAADHISFKEDVQPILELRCLECHQPGGAGYEASGLDMRTYESLMKGTRHGPVVVPGDAFTSHLNALVEWRAPPEIRMPHNKKKLTHCEINIFRRRVNQGANDNRRRRVQGACSAVAGSSPFETLAAPAPHPSRRRPRRLLRTRRSFKYRASLASCLKKQREGLRLEG